MVRKMNRRLAFVAFITLLIGLGLGFWGGRATGEEELVGCFEDLEYAELNLLKLEKAISRLEKKSEKWGLQSGDANK